MLVAAVGAFVNHRLTRARESERWNREDESQRKQRGAELEGLLRLVSVEIALHRALGLEDHLPMDPNQYVTNPRLMRAPGRSLRTDAWEQARPRIAQLLPADRFASLAEYYSNVQWFNELLDDHTSPQTRRTFLPDLAHSLAADGSQMREWMKEEYIGPMNIGF